MKMKTEYGEWLSAQIAAMNTQIDLLRAQTESGTYTAESGFSTAIEALQVDCDQAALKLQGIAPTSTDEWGDVKAGSEEVMDEVRSMLQDAITKIK